MARARVTVLGAGRVGRAIAIDLCKHCDVTIVDKNHSSLILCGSYYLNTICHDLILVGNIPHIIKDADLVISAVPGSIGYGVLRAIIEAGKNVVDISFFAQDPFELDELAKAKSVTAVVDCGVAPGLSNMILGYQDIKMGVESFECLVGGLPFERKWPFEYKAPFSPADVIEEYMRPARCVENGRIVTLPALSESESIYFKNPGTTLEAFNTDGLRTLLKTMPHVPNMKEKTLRYPGHIHLITALKEAGFFSKEPLDFGGQRIRPIDFTSQILFSNWQLGPRELEFTVMRVTITGRGQHSGANSVRFELFDKYDPTTQTSSMARTTGYTCTAVANLVLNGMFTQKGICPPEFIGRQQECFRFVTQYLKYRDVVVHGFYR